MAETATVSTHDVERFSSWCKEHQDAMPSDVRDITARILKVLAALQTVTRAHRNVLKLLRQAMGFVPKSERGAVLTNQ
jgi:hypothetical protein